MSQYEIHGQDFEVVCDRCQFALSEESYIGETAVCQHCGHTMSFTEEGQHRQLQKNYLILVGTLTAFFVLAFIHVINWDRHSFAVVPLQIKYALGMSSQSDLRELSVICTERLKYQCTESVLSRLTSDKASTEDYLRLGDLRRQLGMHNEALIAYEDALTSEAKHRSIRRADIHYGLALSYEALNEKAKAVKHYELALDSKPNVIQITVTESFVRYLQKVGDSEKATQVLKSARKRSGSSRLLAALDTPTLKAAQ